MNRSKQSLLAIGINFVILLNTNAQPQPKTHLEKFPCQIPKNAPRIQLVGETHTSKAAKEAAPKIFEKGINEELIHIDEGRDTHSDILVSDGSPSSYSLESGHRTFSEFSDRLMLYNFLNKLFTKKMLPLKLALSTNKKGLEFYLGHMQESRHLFGDLSLDPSENPFDAESTADLSLRIINLKKNPDRLKKFNNEFRKLLQNSALDLRMEPRHQKIPEFSNFSTQVELYLSGTPEQQGNAYHSIMSDWRSFFMGRAIAKLYCETLSKNLPVVVQVGNSHSEYIRGYLLTALKNSKQEGALAIEETTASQYLREELAPRRGSKNETH